MIEPSRFRHKVTFWQEAAIPDGKGGYTQGLTAVLTTWGAKEQARTTLSYNDLLKIQAGQVVEARDMELFIRYRKDFTPAKDMQMSVDDTFYLLTNPGTPIGEPVKYYKLIGTRKA